MAVNVQFKNFARSTLAIGAASGATSLTVAAGTGSRFPALSGSQYFYATLESAALVREIVKVTARATDVLTVVRAQDGTAATAWNAGDTISIRWNAQAIIDATASMLPTAGGSMTGNLDFSGAGLYITGDFSNATLASRLAFKTSTTNGATYVSANPDGSGTAAEFRAFNTLSPTNSSYTAVGTTATESRVTAEKTGSGSYLPLVTYVGGAERIRTTVNGDTKPFYTNNTTVTATGTFSYSVGTHGQVCLITLTNAITVTFGAPANITEGAMYKFILKAGDTSARTFAWNSAYKFPAATPTLTSGTTTTGAYDVITFIGGASNTLIYDGKVTDVR